MEMRRWCRKTEKGQATLEFLIVFPILFSLFLLALAIATVWNAHNLSSAVSLEAASRESAQAGAGIAFVSGVGNSLSQNTRFGVEVADYWPLYTGAPAKRLTVDGQVSVPWAPFGLNWNVHIQGTTFFPAWEFYGH
jgi:hypothetical protein